jgi:nicotinamidase-related amidase
MTTRQSSHSLLEADDSALVAIDIQAAFLDKLSPEVSELLVSRACWLMAVAQWCGIPLVVTAEEFDRQPLAFQLAQALPAGTPVYDKGVFGLADQPDVLAAVAATGRKTAVLMGLETDVCVAHSALGLLERGYRVAVVADATGSPEPGHTIGLGRMQAAGAIIVSTKSLFYEWLRTLERVQRFHRECPGMRDVPGIAL